MRRPYARQSKALDKSMKTAPILLPPPPPPPPHPRQILRPQQISRELSDNCSAVNRQIIRGQNISSMNEKLRSTEK